MTGTAKTEERELKGTYWLRVVVIPTNKNFVRVDNSDIVFKKKKFNISLPIIKKNFQMDFYSWSFSQPLKINKYGIPEPEKKNIVYPDVLLIPLVAFDKNLNRLGYGGGYYDRLIEKLSKKKNIIK